MNWEPDDRDEEVDTILEDPILSSEGDITTIEEAADEKQAKEKKGDEKRKTSKDKKHKNTRFCEQRAD